MHLMHSGGLLIEQRGVTHRTAGGSSAALQRPRKTEKPPKVTTEISNAKQRNVNSRNLTQRNVKPR